jgi:hypothetical protein
VIFPPPLPAVVLRSDVGFFLGGFFICFGFDGGTFGTFVCWSFELLVVGVGCCGSSTL